CRRPVCLSLVRRGPAGRGHKERRCCIRCGRWRLTRPSSAGRRHLLSLLATLPLPSAVWWARTALLERRHDRAPARRSAGLAAAEALLAERRWERQQVICDLIDGKLALRAAAARVKELNVGPLWGSVLFHHPGADEEERACRYCIMHVRASLQADPR